MRQIGQFIGGKQVPGNSGCTGDVFQPMTGEVIGRVAFAHARRDAARDFVSKVRVGTGGINVPIPDQWRTILLAAGNAPPSVTSTSTVPTRSAFAPGLRPLPHADPPGSRMAPNF